MPGYHIKQILEYHSEGSRRRIVVVIDREPPLVVEQRYDTDLDAWVREKELGVDPRYIA